MEINNIYTKFLECKCIATDTRKIEKDSMFIALKGDNFDANTFAKEAIEKGAKYVIIDNQDYQINDKTILVENSLETLQRLASFHRKKLKTKLIALTGSNGKTTTKELINVVLSQKYNTIATIGNLNNHIGVPLTLLRLTQETEIGIIEMGANHQKEIEFLCKIAEPDFGYITNFGKAHLEGFGGEEGVIKGKSEMYIDLKNNEKTVFVNEDDALQNQKTVELNRYTFSSKNNNSDVYIKSIVANPMVKIEFENEFINSNLIGLYNASNICVAITIGKYFQVSNTQIKSAIENYKPENNRSQIIYKNSNEIILDAYNANPNSMKEAILNFKQLQKDEKIVILGDMFELGVDSKKEHQKIITLLENERNIKCYFIGNHFFENKTNGINFLFFENFIEFKIYLEHNLPKNNLILIKGSRGMALEKTLELFD